MSARKTRLQVVVDDVAGALANLKDQGFLMFLKAFLLGRGLKGIAPDLAVEIHAAVLDAAREYEWPEEEVVEATAPMVEAPSVEDVSESSVLDGEPGDPSLNRLVEVALGTDSAKLREDIVEEKFDRLTELRALGIIQNSKDPESRRDYHFFAVPADMLKHRDETSGHWRSMVTGDLLAEGDACVINKILICERPFGERLARKVGQRVYDIQYTLDHLQQKLDQIKDRQKADDEKKAILLKDWEDFKANFLAMADEEIADMDSLLVSGQRLIDLYPAGGSRRQFARDEMYRRLNLYKSDYDVGLRDRFPNSGSLSALQEVLDAMLVQKRSAPAKSFLFDAMQVVVGLLFTHRRELQSGGPRFMGDDAPKPRKNDDKRVRQLATSLGIEAGGKSAGELERLIREKRGGGKKDRGNKGGRNRR